MRLILIIFSILSIQLLASSSVSAQIKVTNEDGDKIILMPDGTWRYADDNKQASADDKVKAKQKAGQPKIDKKKLSKAEKKRLKQLEKQRKRSEEIKVKLAKQREKEAKKAEKKAEKLAKKNTKKQDGKKEKTPKTAKKENKKENKKRNKKDKNTASKKAGKEKNNRLADKEESPSVIAKKPSPKLRNKLVKQQFKPFKIPEIVIPKQECNYSMNEVDPFSGKKKVSIEPSFFFGYTHPKLERFMRGDYYITCEGFMSEVGGLRALNLKFIIDSPTAQEDYGILQEGSRILVNLLDGTTVTLMSAEQDGGRIDRVKKQTIYSTYFIVDARSEKKFRKSEISQVRVVWSEGFEDYEVFEVDFIINQLNCLDNAK